MMEKFMGSMKKFFTSKKMRYGSVSGLIIVIVIAILVVVNILTGALVTKYNLKLDISKGHLYGLSSQTTETLKQVKQDIKVTTLLEQGQESSFQLITEILHRYAGKSSHIKLANVDPVKNPTFATQYEQQGVQVGAGSIIFESGNKVKVVSPSDLSSQDAQSGEQSLTAEQRFTSAILYVTGEKVPMIYMVKGHNESDYAGAKSLLERENYKTNTLDLFTAVIPKDAALLMVVSPKKDFTADEINKIDQYLDAGGRVEFFLDLTKDSLPKLEAYIKEWGASLDRDVVFEKDQSNWMNSPAYIIPTLQSHEITDKITGSNLSLYMPVCRSITLVPNSALQITSLIKSSANSFGKTDLNNLNGAQQPTDKKGPFDLAVAVVKGTNNAANPDARIVVAGNSAFLTDNFITEPRLSNAEFFLSSVNWMAGKTESLNIIPKSLTSDRLTVNQAQLSLLALLVIVLIPLFVLISGGVVWFRRRHL